MAQDQSTERACPAQDIISVLPDDIRQYILSLLPRRDAARTGVLSSRWKGLWAKRFPHPTCLIFGRPTDNMEDQRKLANEIKEYMSQHGERKIETFNMYFYPGKEHEEVASRWIQQAIRNGVEEFHLDFSQGSMGRYPCKQIIRRSKKFELKDRLFRGNNTLVSLRLNYCRLQQYFKFKNFNSLEILCLRQINVNDHMFEKLVSNCPRLASLELRQCSCLMHVRVPNTLFGLKKLIIANCCMIKEISMSAPSLQAFHFFGIFPCVFIMHSNMTSLNDVILTSPSRGLWHIGMTTRSVSVWLEPVKVLTLGSLSLSAIFGRKDTTSVTFGHLKELQLLLDMYSDFNSIYSLLKKSWLPILERMFIELPKSGWDHSPGDNAQHLKELPSITFEHLKLIKIERFRGFMKEMILLDFLLRSAINLERLILVFPRELYAATANDYRLCLIHKIMLKPRASVRAEIVMIYTHHDDYSFRAAHSNAIVGFQHEQAEISNLRV